MKLNHTRGIAFGLTAGALAVALACAGCSGTAQNGSASGGSAQNSSAASNVETSNVPVENANANQNASASASDESNASQSSNSNATAAVVDGDAEDAKGVLPDGWYSAALTGEQGDSSLTNATVDGDTWTLSGSFTRADSQDGLYGSDNPATVGPNTWSLKVSDNTTFEAGPGPQAADRGAFERTMQSLNGLGLELHVEGGQITYARLVS